MIDIHTHLLFGVDDGAKSLEESVAMLEDAKRQGIEKCILTPHYRHGMFPYDKEKIDEHFEILKKELDFFGNVSIIIHVADRSAAPSQNIDRGLV